jgi:hypothetical protein
MQTQSPAFAAWLDEFFAAYYRRRPVNATFIGVHDHDRALPDFSEQGAGDTLAEMENLLDRLYRLPPEAHTRAEAMDRELANAHARSRYGIQQVRVRGHRKVRCVALWVAITHNLLVWIRHLRQAVSPPSRQPQQCASSVGV